MKTTRLIIFIFVSSLAFTSCLKDPGDLSLSVGKTALAIDEEVTLTLVGAENYTCLQWRFVDDAHTVVSGGGESDLTMTCKFSAAGSYTIVVAVKNCKDGCVGTCRDEYVEVTFVVE